MTERTRFTALHSGYVEGSYFNHKEVGLVIKESEVVWFLSHLAEKFAVTNCMTAECDVCVAAVATWWDWCNNLSGPARVRMQRTLAECDIPLPPHFGDLVGPSH